MTSAPLAARTAASPWGPGALVLRARTLLVAGLLGGHVAAILVVVLSGMLQGPRAAASAAIAAVVTIAFFAIGQGVQVIYANADPRRVLVAALLSYFLRVGVLGSLLAIAMRSARVAAALSPEAIFAGAVVTLLGWLTVELVAWKRLRIPVYDTEYDGPDNGGSTT